MTLLQEGLRNEEKDLDCWISAIESQWKVIPEFSVDREKFKHLAIICDGNRRAASERGFHPWCGHRAGIEVIKGVMRASKEWGIGYLTFWTWSTENWKREKEQVDFVMNLAAKNLREGKVLEELVKNEAKFVHIGRKDRLPDSVSEAIIDLERKTQYFDQYTVNLALDYGGLDEMARAIAHMMDQGISPAALRDRPELILDFLDTAGQPLPDLVIRTGTREGEIPHASGFMPLQAAYAGWAFLPDPFPDLTPSRLLQPIQNYMGYEKRKGK